MPKTEMTVLASELRPGDTFDLGGTRVVVERNGYGTGARRHVQVNPPGSSKIFMGLFLENMFPLDITRKKPKKK